MKDIKNLLRRLSGDESGAETIEYALIMGLIVVVVITIVGHVGTKVLARWNSVNSSM